MNNPNEILIFTGIVFIATALIIFGTTKDPKTLATQAEKDVVNRRRLIGGIMVIAGIFFTFFPMIYKEYRRNNWVPPEPYQPDFEPDF